MYNKSIYISILSIQLDDMNPFMILIVSFQHYKEIIFRKCQRAIVRRLEIVHCS
jgi:hypothetical protein